MQWLCGKLFEIDRYPVWESGQISRVSTIQSPA